MTWLELIRHELGPIPMFMWQYVAVLGLLAVILVLTRRWHISQRQAGMLYSLAMGLAGYLISALLYVYVPPPSSAPIRYDLLFLAGMLGGWRGGLVGFLLIFGARLQWTGTVFGVYAALDMGLASLGGIVAHHWYRHFDLADIGLRQLLWMWLVRTLTLVGSGLLLVVLHHLPSGWVLFDLFPQPNAIGSLVRKALMSAPALLFFAGVFAMFRLDAEDRRRQRQEWHNTRRDSLTQLPNRRALNEYLSAHAHDDPAYKMSMISLGVLNHTQMLLAAGHGWGDQFLRRLASYVHEAPLDQLLHEYDVKAFQFSDLALVLVLKNIGASEVERSGLATRLHQELSLKLHGENAASPTPALTLTVAACDFRQHHDAAGVLRDLGLHLQSQGRELRNVNFLQSSFSQAAQREVDILESLGIWIDNGNPPLAYMPKCDLRTRQVLGAEALLRYRDPQNRAVSPGQVLAIASRHKLLGAFEWSTIERVCADYRRWANVGGACPLSVNISSASLVSIHFAKHLIDLLNVLELPPHAIVLEITENDPIPDIDTVRENVRLLTEAGIKLSLDDFGSGYSGLTVLARFQFAELKVDHTMVALIGNPRMHAAIQLALESAQRYGATFVAEGVENWEQLDALHSLGITQGQGYHFSRELPLEHLIRFTEQARHAWQEEQAPMVA